MSLLEFWNTQWGWQIMLSLVGTWLMFTGLGIFMGWMLGKHFKK